MKLIAALIVVLTATAGADPTMAHPQPPEVLYTEGQAAYSRADYTVAISRWQAAFQLSGATDLLFNIAQAMRLSGDCAGAVKTYKRFMAAEATSRTAEQRKLSEDFVRELELTCPEKRILVPPKAVAAARNNGSLKIAGIMTGSAGAVSIVTGLFLGHHGASMGAGVAQACTTSCDWAMQKGNDAAGRRDVAIGYALDGIGAAAIVGGAILYYLGEREHVVIAPLSREGGAVVSWSGSW